MESTTFLCLEILIADSGMVTPDNSNNTEATALLDNGKDNDSEVLMVKEAGIVCFNSEIVNVTSASETTVSNFEAEPRLECLIFLNKLDNSSNDMADGAGLA